MTHKTPDQHKKDNTGGCWNWSCRICHKLFKVNMTKTTEPTQDVIAIGLMIYNHWHDWCDKEKQNSAHMVCEVYKAMKSKEAAQ